MTVELYERDDLDELRVCLRAQVQRTIDEWNNGRLDAQTFAREQLGEPAARPRRRRDDRDRRRPVGADPCVPM